MFCSKCGTKNSDESKFCFNCGNGLSIAELTATTTSNSIEESKPYISPYEDEETVFSSYGKNIPDKRIFPKDKKDIPLLTNPNCDIFYTTRRICLTMGDPNVKSPSPTKWFIPLGGGVGALANLVLQDAINSYKNSQFKKKHGSTYAPTEIDIMCMAGNAIYSKGPVSVELFKDKSRFFNTIGNDPKFMNVSFTADYQYQDRTIRGSIIMVCTQDVNGTIKELKKLPLANIEISNLHRDDIENAKYLASKIS